MFDSNTTGQSSTPTSAGSAPAGKGKRALLGIVTVVALAALAAAAWFFLGRGGEQGGVAQSEGAERTVAMVNGASVTRGDLDKKLEQVRAASPAASSAEDAGFELQVLDELVNLRLLVSLAEERGMTVTDDAIKSEMDGLVKAFGGPDVLAERLNQAKLTQEELNENIRNEILVRQLVDADTDIELATTTDAEVRAKYDEVAAANKGGDFPPFEQVSEMIRAQLLQEKSAKIVQDYITAARAKANIQVLL